MIPFITRYKGNHRNPYRILGFPKKKSKFSKIFENKIFEKKFSSRKKISDFFRTPMSTQNLPRIPKIALRTACGEAKESKNTRSTLFSEFPDPGILLHSKSFF